MNNNNNNDKRNKEEVKYCRKEEKSRKKYKEITNDLHHRLNDLEQRIPPVRQ